MKTSDVRLLNPEVDHEAVTAFIDLIGDRVAKLQTELTTSVLDRETYLLKIGASQELNRLASEMQREYDRRFKV